MDGKTFSNTTGPRSSWNQTQEYPNPSTPWKRNGSEGTSKNCIPKYGMLYQRTHGHGTDSSSKTKESKPTTPFTDEIINAAKTSTIYRSRRLWKKRKNTNKTPLTSSSGSPTPTRPYKGMLTTRMKQRN